MQKSMLINRNNKEGIGKYFLKRSVDFALVNNFEISCEFIKLGLDFLTCDCLIGGWRNDFNISNKILFNNSTFDNLSEYHFVKGYLLSFEKDETDLKSALFSIEKYLLNNDDCYGNYIKGKILTQLGRNVDALAYFHFSSGISSSLQDYRIGRLKEDHLHDEGINYIYQSFIQNPSSYCCARILKKTFQKQHLHLEFDKNNSNILLDSFTKDDDEYIFGMIYHKFINNEFLWNDLSECGDNPYYLSYLSEYNEGEYFETLPLITNFIEILKNNQQIFTKDFNNISDEDEEESNQSYSPWDDISARDAFDTDEQYDEWINQ